MKVRHLVDKLPRGLTRLTARYRKSGKGAIAVEVALIAPILATIAFFSYDIAAVTKSRDRAQFTYYSLADTITSRTTNVTCDYLDLIGDLAYESFTTGNYASRDGKQTELPVAGASDFKFQIRGLKVQDPAVDPSVNPNRLKAEIMWAFHRTGQTISARNGRKPGKIMNIPEEYRIPGEFLLLIEGRHFVRAPLNLFGAMNSTARINYTSFTSPRYLAEIDLVGPEVVDRCEYD